MKHRMLQLGRGGVRLITLATNDHLRIRAQAIGCAAL